MRSIFWLVGFIAVAAYVAKTIRDANGDGRDFQPNAYFWWRLFAIIISYAVWAFALSQKTFLAVWVWYNPGPKDFSHGIILMAVIALAVIINILDPMFISFANKTKKKTVGSPPS